MPTIRNEPTPDQMKFFEGLLKSTHEHINEALKNAHAGPLGSNSRSELCSVLSAVASNIIVEAILHSADTAKGQAEVCGEIMMEIAQLAKVVCSTHKAANALGLNLSSDLEALKLFPREGKKAPTGEASPGKECGCMVCQLNRAAKANT